MSALDRILSSYREAAASQREKGTYFERLSAAFLRNDPVQAQQYSQVWSFAEWAAANGSERAAEFRDQIAQQMTAEQISSAHELAQRCMATSYVDCE